MLTMFWADDRQLRRTCYLVLMAIAVSVATVIPPSRSPAAQRTGSGREGSDFGNGEQQGMRVREGTTVELTGYFNVAGDRAVFTSSDGSGRYSGLENLNLERIAIAVSESPDQLIWNVTGTITEFRGTNYLLVSRALLKSKPTSKAPAERSTPKTLPGKTEK